mgnify:FL=1
MPGFYKHDSEGLAELFKAASSQEGIQAYLESTCYSVQSHEEYLEKRVGVKKLLEIESGEEIREGYDR